MKALFSILFLFAHAKASDIVISAEKISKNINSSTNNLTFIGSDEIASKGWKTLSDALLAQPGVYISGAGSMSNVASLRLNGVQRGSSKIIIDDIEYNDPTDIDNSFQLNQLDLSGVESIEILKGSQSTIYGSDSIGGVIKITTKKSKETQNTLNLSHASHNTNSLNYSSLSQNSSFTGSYIDSAGISSYKPAPGQTAEKDRFSKVSLGGNFKKNLQDITLKVQTHFLKSTTEIDDYKSDRANDDSSNFEMKNYLILAEKKLLNDKINSKLGFTQTFIHRDARGKYPTLNIGREDKLSLNLTHYYNENLTNLMGLELQKLKASDTFDFSNQTTKSNHNLSAFAASSLNVNSVFLDLSARVEDNSEFDQKSTFKIGIGKKINHLIVSSNYATGYKSPTLYQLNAGSGNLDLKPVDSVYADLSLKFNFENIKYNFMFFKYDFKNQIDYDNSNSKYVNLSQTEIYGFENNLQYQSQKIIFNLNSTINHSKNKATGKYLERSPRLMLKSWIGYQGPINCTLESIYIGQRNDSGALPSYTLFNFSTNYNNFKISLNNILDKDYEDIRSYSTYGRTFEISYKMNL